MGHKHYYEKEIGVNKDSYFWQESEKKDDRYEQWKEQRKKYGFDARETWSLDGTLATYIYPRLCMFRDIASGYPRGETEESWLKKLDEMIFAFRVALTHWNVDYTDEEWERARQGRLLFAEWYHDLWW